MIFSSSSSSLSLFTLILTLSLLIYLYSLALPYSTALSIGSDLQPATTHGSLFSGSVISTAEYTELSCVRKVRPCSFLPPSSCLADSLFLRPVLSLPVCWFLLHLPLLRENHCPELPLPPILRLPSSQPPVFNTLESCVCVFLSSRNLSCGFVWVLLWNGLIDPYS